jgi:murein L,D-transpeptidase YcbB/YkuD
MNGPRRWIALVFSLLLTLIANSQVQPDSLKQYLSRPEWVKQLNLHNPRQTLEFYQALAFRPAWNEQSTRTLLSLFQSADSFGLNPSDYLQAGPANIHFPSQDLASIAIDIQRSDAALHFFNDLAYGNTEPPLGYNGPAYHPSGYALPALLADYLGNGRLDSLPAFVEPALPEVRAIHSKIIQLLRLQASSDLKEEKILSNAANIHNKALLKKLYFLGIIDSATLPHDSLLRKALRLAQRAFGLFDDGMMRSTLMEQLNIPIRVRIQQLKLALNYYRWLHCLASQQPVVVVNIPAAFLKVYQGDSILLSMRMIVGKPSTPTPTLCSTIDEVILYPYWTVPRSIIGKEWLPAVRRNPAYVDANNFQVLDSRARILDPYKINWHSITASNFPYTVRQSTGCDNALGLIKLNFYSPFGVYLHDTPDKGLFLLNKRFFSHGCMRMENPMDLGHLVLQNNAIAIDTVEQKGCLLHQSPVSVPADLKLTVLVWYNPAGLDKSGHVVFYEDVYRKFNW